MLRKVSKLCLVVVTAACLSGQAMAADPEVSVGGEVEFGMAQTTEKDGPTALDMDSSASVVVEGSVKAGAWTATGVIDAEFTADGFAPLNRILTVQNDSLSIAMGNFEFDADDIGMGKDYLVYVDESMGGYGVSILESGVANGGGDFVKIGLKETGLTVVVGINELASDASEVDDDSNGEGDAYSETALGVYYGGEFGDLALSAAYASVSTKIDEKNGNAVKAGSYDGATGSELAVAVNYGLGEMAFSLNVDQSTVTAGTAGAEDEKTMIMEFVFDMGLGDDSGISVAYGTGSTDDGSPEKTLSTSLNIGYARPFAGASLSLGYAATTEKDDDDGTDASTSVIGAGLTFEF